MNPNEGNAFSFYQKIFDDSYNQVASTKKKIHGEALFRRGLGYLLKGIAVFGGITIAAGVPEKAAHAIGIAITVVVALDGLLSSHLRLITLTKADHAYKHLLKDTENEHGLKLAPILVLKETDENAAKAQLNELNSSLKKRLDAEAKKIEIAIDETDVKALDALSLEAERRQTSRRQR
jgi:hypothetical protein